MDDERWDLWCGRGFSALLVAVAATLNLSSPAVGETVDVARFEAARTIATALERKLCLYMIGEYKSSKSDSEYFTSVFALDPTLTPEHPAWAIIDRELHEACTDATQSGAVFLYDRSENIYSANQMRDAQRCDRTDDYRCADILVTQDQSLLGEGWALTWYVATLLRMHALRSTENLDVGLGPPSEEAVVLFSRMGRDLARYRELNLLIEQLRPQRNEPQHQISRSRGDH